MIPRSAIRAIWFELLDQTRSSGLAYVLAATVLAAVGACLFTQYDEPAQRLQLAGAALLQEFDRSTSANYLNFTLLDLAADKVGILAILLWSAGFVPAFVDPAESAVALSKPMPRLAYLSLRVGAVIAYVGAYLLLYCSAITVCMGLRWNIWNASGFIAVPVGILHFACFFSFSCLLGIYGRSSAVAMIGTLVFWAAAYGINYGHHALIGLELAEAPAEGLKLLHWCYWALPKPCDFSMLLHDGMQAQRFFQQPSEVTTALDKGSLHAGAAIASSLAFAATFYGLTIYEYLHLEL